MRSTRVSAMILALFLAILGGVFLTASGGRAQDAPPERPSHIHEGSCDELGAVIQPLTFLNVPSGPVAGSSGAVVAEAAFTSIPQTLDELLAADHSLKVHLSREQIEIYLACGDIGGALDADGALIVGMKELDGSGYTGIAYLVPAANGTTSISVMIAKVLPGTPGADGAAQEATAPAAAEAGPNIVNVTLTEFTIDMPTELPAGATRFTVANNGSAPHNFVIEGEGISRRLANNLTPGQTGNVNVDLAPGTYTIYCPVGEGAHRANGMEVTLTVS